MRIAVIAGFILGLSLTVGPSFGQKAADTCACCQAKDDTAADLLETILDALQSKVKELKGYQCKIDYVFKQPLLDLFRGLLLNRLAAVRAMRSPQTSHHQPQVVVDFRHRRNRAARILIAGALIDAQRRLESLDQVHIGTLHLMQKLPSVDRQAFDELTLTFREQRVEGQAALARSAGSGQHHQPITRDVEAHILQIVNACPPNPDQRFAVDVRLRTVVEARTC